MHKLNNDELTLEHLLYIRFIGLIYQRRIGKVTFPFRGLFGQNVAFVGMLPFDFSGPRKRKPFLGTGFRFHFWHVTFVN